MDNLVRIIKGAEFADSKFISLPFIQARKIFDTLKEYEKQKESGSIDYEKLVETTGAVNATNNVYTLENAGLDFLVALNSQGQVVPNTPLKIEFTQENEITVHYDQENPITENNDQGPKKRTIRQQFRGNKDSLDLIMKPNVSLLFNGSQPPIQQDPENLEIKGRRLSRGYQIEKLTGYTTKASKNPEITGIITPHIEYEVEIHPLINQVLLKEFNLKYNYQFGTDENPQQPIGRVDVSIKIKDEGDMIDHKYIKSANIKLMPVKSRFSDIVGHRRWQFDDEGYLSQDYDVRGSENNSAMTKREMINILTNWPGDVKIDPAHFTAVSQFPNMIHPLDRIDYANTIKAITSAFDLTSDMHRFHAIKFKPYTKQLSK